MQLIVALNKQHIFKYVLRPGTSDTQMQLLIKTRVRMHQMQSPNFKTANIL